MSVKFWIIGELWDYGWTFDLDVNLWIMGEDEYGYKCEDEDRDEDKDDNRDKYEDKDEDEYEDRDQGEDEDK